jgi:hypothetical protein
MSGVNVSRLAEAPARAVLRLKEDDC